LAFILTHFAAAGRALAARLSTPGRDL